MEYEVPIIKHMQLWLTFSYWNLIDAACILSTLYNSLFHAFVQNIEPIKLIELSILFVGDLRRAQRLYTI